MLERLRSTEAEPSAISMIVADRVLWAITALAALLMFWSLGGRYLWQDEAETALLGKNILMYWVPRAYDGTNIISQETSREFNEHDYLWRWSPWIQYYVAAMSIALLGPSTVAARLPFALFGVLTVPATYLLARRLFQSVTVARLSAFFLTVSVPFLLHSRQCRWYAVFYLVSVFLLLCLAQMVRGRRLAWLGFAAAAIAAFYTNYLTGVGFVACVTVAALLVRRDRRFVGQLAAAALVIVLACAPGLLFSNVLGHAGTETREAQEREANNKAARAQAAQRGRTLPQHPFDGFPRVVKQAMAYGSELFTYLLPLPIVLLLAFVMLRSRRTVSSRAAYKGSAADAKGSKEGIGAGRGLADDGALAENWARWALALMVFCALYVIYISSAPWVMFRYVSVLAPVSALLMGLSVYWVFRWKRGLAIALVVILACCNLVHMVPFALPRTQMAGQGIANRRVPLFPWAVPRDTFPEAAGISSPFFGYLYEITHSFDDGEAGMIQYIRDNAGPNDIVLTTYGDLPLQYYTGLQVVGGLQGQNLPPGFRWIIFRGFVISQAPGKDAKLYAKMLEYLSEHPDRFTEVPFQWKDYGPPGNCPEPQYHLFHRPPQVMDIHVLHRRPLPQP